MSDKNRWRTWSVKALATGFGSGYSPVAPGTAGSLVGVAVFLLIKDLPLAFYILFTLAVTVAGVPISTLAEKIFGEKDSQKIVIDEIAGILISLIAVPAGVYSVTAGFLLFRFFDIWKPFRFLEKFEGGLGVMADDVAAGLAALAALHLGLIIYG